MGVNLQKNIKIIINQRLEEEVDKKDKSQQKKSVKIVLFKFKIKLEAHLQSREKLQKNQQQKLIYQEK